MKQLPQLGIKHASLTEEVSSAVRELIISGQLAPGEPLRERALAEQLAVSRIPLRESLIQLGHEGFVHAVPRRGTFVSEVDAESIAELFDVRETLEGMAARLAAARRADDDLSRLRAAIEREHGPAGDEAVSADAEFHQALIDAAHHRRLSTLMAPVQGHIRRVFYLTSRRLPVQMPDAHALIVEAIEAGEPAAARCAAEEHVRSVRAATMEYIESTS